LSIPALGDRARQALELQALQPIAETVAAPNSYGVRPKRQCADASAPCCNVLRQHTSAPWILAGAIHGFFAHMAFSWIEAHLPMQKGVWSQGLRRGGIDHGALAPPTAGVPQGGSISPVVSHGVLDGLEAVVHGSAWQRRVHHIHDVRWTDDCIVTAHARQGCEATILPRSTACFAERGVRLATAKTVMPSIIDGFDFLGQTLRQQARRHGTPATLQRTPSPGRCQGIKTPVKALGQPAVGATPVRRIERLNPGWRGGAHAPRHILGAATCATLASFVWRRRYRWAKQRPPETTGRWITKR
jgi:RNA-directed DNA polymerase